MASGSHPKVSVIIPAYNVEGFVRRCVESVLRQTLKNFELLVVDDGSSDRTGALLDSMAERDIRISVFHVENGGAPAARNFALDRARGTYVCFMDADDWAEPSMLENMVALMENNNLELGVAGFHIDTYWADGERFQNEVKSYPSVVYPTQEAFREDAWQLFDRNLLYTPRNKLFVRSRIEELGLRFAPTFWDDFPFVLAYIRDIERVGVTEEAYYHFTRARGESETARWREGMYEKREEEHGWMLDLYEHWGLSDDENSREMVQRRYIERLVGCIENTCDPACELPASEKKQVIKEMICSERAQEAVVVAKPRSGMMKLMLVPIRMKSAGLAYTEGKLISFVKRNNTQLFATLKARR